MIDALYKNEFHVARKSGQLIGPNPNGFVWENHFLRRISETEKFLSPRFIMKNANLISDNYSDCALFFATVFDTAEFNSSKKLMIDDCKTRLSSAREYLIDCAVEFDEVGFYKGKWFATQGIVDPISPLRRRDMVEKLCKELRLLISFLINVTIADFDFITR